MGLSSNESVLMQPESNILPLGDSNDVSHMAALFDDFMKFGPVGLHIVNDDGIIVWANQAELDLLGYSQEEYFGQPISKFHVNPAKLNGILKTLLSGNKVEAVVAPMRCKDGHTEYVEINSSMRQENGKCITMRCFSARVTDRILKEQAQVEVIARQREAVWVRKETERKSDFLRKLCHELRNPLAGVSGNLELLIAELVAADAEMTCENSNSAEERLAVIQQHLVGALDHAKSAQLAAEHEMLVINDTLSLSRLESKEIEFHPKPVDVSKVLEGATAIIGVKAQEKKIELRVDLAEEARYIKTDPVWVKQVILNLLSNSLKFTGHEGRVDIRVNLVVVQHVREEEEKQGRPSGKKEEERMLQIQVQDTGIGMTLEEQDKLFGLFSQANEMISAKFGGSGLGLHIIKQVLDHVGGMVKVTSTKGVGSTFDLTLPCGVLTSAERASLSPSLTSTLVISLPHRSATRDVRVLIVDDIYMNRKILASYFDKRGYIFEVAENGQIAFDLHQNEPFDIILSDVDMPVMDGHEMTRLIRIKEEAVDTKRTPIVGISGNVFQEDVDASREAGMNEFVSKPFKFQELEVLMCRLLLPG